MNTGFKHVYGPVPSRRLGRSLGVDALTFKSCSFDCVYCQLGRTTNHTIERKEYIPTADILDEVRRKLENGDKPEYISFAGSGEPTLHSGLGDIIRGIKAMTDVPVVVFTNGSLLWMPEVRADLAAADVVIPSLDGGDAALLDKVNRPAASLDFDRIVEGLIAFRGAFNGQIWLEVMLLGGISDDDASVDAIARVEGRDFEVVDRQMGVGGQMVTIRTPSAVYEDVFVPLFGEYQAHNAAAALVAVEAFMGGRGLDGRIVEQGLMNASSPGRMQVVRHSPTIIVDAAHNPAGAATLREAVESSFSFARIAGVYSAMGDKDVEGVLSEVEPFIDHLVVTQMPGDRAANLERLAQIAGEVFGPDRVDVRESLADAVDRAAEIAEAGAEPADRSGILVFGSVMLAGEMLALACHSPR